MTDTQPIVATPTKTTTYSDPEPTPLPGIPSNYWVWISFILTLVLLGLQDFSSSGIMVASDYRMKWIAYFVTFLIGLQGIVNRFSHVASINQGKAMARKGM